MLNKKIKDSLPKIQKYLASQPVEKAWLFGSYSRGEEKPDSDIDILVRYNDSDSMSLLTISGITIALSKLLNTSVDLVEDQCLLPFARKSVDNDKILIYERKD